MFLKRKKRISELVDTIYEMLEILYKLHDKNSAIDDCLAAVSVILEQLENEKDTPKKTITKLYSIRENFYYLRNDNKIISKENIIFLKNEVILTKTIFKDEVKAKLNIVFFPYKASMWDSLETVYEAALKDEDCIAQVVPIPYYKLSKDNAIQTYEGNQFPKNVPIKHYSEYNLQEEEPDIIFVHNIYDQYNTITQVYEEYFTSNLKKYTDMLVYVPYHISSFVASDKNSMYLAYDIPSVKNVDKIILSSEHVKKVAIRDGISEEKVLLLGSPKLDHMVSLTKKDISYPKEWKEKLEGKTVYLLNTGCLFFADQPFLKVGVLSNILNISNIDENSVLIWRPHPLTRISIMKYTPELLSYYDILTHKYINREIGMYNNVILDETDDYLPVLKMADVLISADGSLLRSYLLTEKKVLFLDKEMPKNSLVPSNAFYYFYDKDEPWYELVKKFSKGYDTLAKNRKGIASKVYANTDGTCGEKVYKAIKECVLDKNSN